MRLRKFALFGIALCGVFVAFVLSALLTRVPIPSEPGPGPPIDAECRGPWKDVQITQAQLDRVLEAHNHFLARTPAPVPGLATAYQPVKTYAIDQRSAKDKSADALPPSVTGAPVEVDDTDRADLCGARLTNVDFKGADLRFARFMGARFENVMLAGAKLSWSYFRRAGFLHIAKQGRATFYGADLIGVMMFDSDMSDWSFEQSDLSFAITRNVIFANAQFDGATLGGATFEDDGFKDATFYRAKFAHTRLEIRPGQLLVIPSLRDADGLTSLHALFGGASVLVELREQLKKAGFDLQAQQVNFALNSFSDDNGFPGARALNYALFGIPYAYGMKPERTLLTGLILIPVFTAFYALAVYGKPGGLAGRLWVIRSAPKSNPKRTMRPIALSQRNCKPIQIALWFSILSAFRIGWHEFNVGDWIARVQSSDYKLEADGWTRSIAGMQSLVSVYLLALAAASYFSK